MKVHVIHYNWDYKQNDLSEEDSKTLHGTFRLPKYIVGTRIRNAFTGFPSEDSSDIVGSKNEYKYYRAMIEGNKTFWSSEDEYLSWQTSELPQIKKNGKIIPGRLTRVSNL